jgi:putative endonuclease
MHFVYIIYSDKFDKYYKGYSQRPYHRLEEHNLGLSRYTKHFIPWKLVYLESFPTKRQALIREKGIKKYSKSQILDLIDYSSNEI